MKSLKGMKLSNKWMILLTGVFIFAVGGFTHTSTLVAAQAEEDLLMTMDYLDPFDLTVSSLSVSRASTGGSLKIAVAPASEPASAPASEPEPVSAEITPDSYSLYAQPLKIWIPYRPTFRSPCTPSW